MLQRVRQKRGDCRIGQGRAQWDRARAGHNGTADIERDKVGGRVAVGIVESGSHLCLLHCTALYSRNSTVQYSAVQCSIVQCCAVQHSTVQYSAVEVQVWCSTAQQRTQSQTCMCIVAAMCRDMGPAL